MTHPDAETIAALAEGRLDPAKLDAVLTHVEACHSCMDALDASNAVLREDAPRRIPRATWWLAAAAAVILAVGLIAIRESRSSAGVAELVKLSPRSVRVVEPRLSGGFGWAPYRGPMRAGNTVTDAERLRIGGAAADAIDRAERDASPEAQHVAGVAILLAGDPAKAIDRLREASKQSPHDAQMASDLAAALYTEALTRQRASLYADALAAADRALRADARHAEASFNRALILERLGVTPEARRAWETYLAIDPSSPWADEARRRLARLTNATKEDAFKGILPRLESAAARGDMLTVRELVNRFPTQARTYGEAEYLGQWSERNLAIARALGDALAARSGESLLRDAVAVIDRADPAQRATLARAHAAYRNGRIAYVRQRFDEGERELRIATQAFEDARSPMAFLSRFFAACIRFDRHDPGAREQLVSLLRELDAHPAYRAVRAHTRWELALCDMVSNDWGATLAQLDEAEQLFAALGERGNLAFIRSMRATALMSIGRPDEAWAARAAAFEALSDEPHGDRLAVAIGAAARMELRAGRFTTARALFGVEVAETRRAGNDFMLSDALVRNALASNDDGDRVTASNHVREAVAAAHRIADRALRDRAIADTRVAAGAVALHEDPDRAIAELGAAIDFYRQRDLAAYLAVPYRYRARAWTRLGNRAEGLRDLDRAIAIMERDPVALGSPEPFEDAIRLSLDAGDTRRAFAYAERARGQVHALEELQRKLRGTTTTVLHLTALLDEIASFAITANDLGVSRTRIARERLATLTETELYDVLIRPSEKLIAHDLVVIADAHLESVPFAALYDAQRNAHLVERTAISSAASARSLEIVHHAASRSVAAVTLLEGERLPAAEEEPAAIRRLYQSGRVLPGNNVTFRAIRDAAGEHDVVHIAGHTERRGDDDTALLLGSERVAWTEIAATPLSRRTVFVLAGCETMRGPAAPFVRSMSIGAAFVAAGAGSAIGTLTPIADEDARELFLSIHRQLAAGAGPAEAVRRTQLDAIASGRLPSWRAIALRTSCIWR